MRIYLLLLFLSFGCYNVEIDSSMGVEREVASIGNSTDNIDNSIARSIESGDISQLPSVYKETKNIRLQTKEIKKKVKEIVESKEALMKELEEDKRMVWVDLCYELAPLVMGFVALIIGRLTNDIADTKFGILCFFMGALLTALHHVLGYWGMIIIGCLSIAWFFYSFEKKDIAKKQKPINMS